MPFDGEMTRLEKLERLRGLLDDATDREQWSFRTCLWSRACRDEALVASGFNVSCIPTVEAVNYATGFFGLPGVFGPQSVEAKRARIDWEIRKEKGELERAEAVVAA